MLERLRLTDFKSFVDEEAELAPLTLLVGANASGKSNFLDALRFLRQTKIDKSWRALSRHAVPRPRSRPAAPLAGLRGLRPRT